MCYFPFYISLVEATILGNASSNIMKPWRFLFVGNGNLARKALPSIIVLALSNNCLALR